MVFFNYATMQMAAKIVYYGPGLCGKTTNLHYIYTKTSPQSRGEMVSLETETDRTLFFDLLPIDVGVIGGFKTRLQLYTVPGQVFYNTTRKLVLKGVDGIVYVADSQRAMLDANYESFKNLHENLTEIGLSLDDLPLVVQLNKRDLPNVADREAILSHLDPSREFESVEAVAASGTGVFETLKLISKLTLRTLRRRMTSDEPLRPTVSRRLIDPMPAMPRDLAPRARTLPGTAPIESLAAEKPGAPAAAPDITPPFEAPDSEPAPAGEVGAGDVFGDGTDVSAPPSPELVETLTIADLAPASEETSTVPPVDSVPAPQAVDVETTVAKGSVDDDDTVSSSPEASTSDLQAADAGTVDNETPVRPEPEIDFKQAERPTRKADVKHVKMRTSVDVMAELEALRKRATQSAPRSRKEPSGGTTAVPTSHSRRDLHRTITMEAAAEARSLTRSVRITVSFEGENGILQTEERSVSVDEVSELRSLSVDLKIALE